VRCTSRCPAEVGPIQLNSSISLLRHEGKAQLTSCSSTFKSIAGRSQQVVHHACRLDSHSPTAAASSKAVFYLSISSGQIRATDTHIFMSHKLPGHVMAIENGLDSLQLPFYILQQAQLRFRPLIGNDSAFEIQAFLDNRRGTPRAVGGFRRGPSRTGNRVHP